MGGIWRYEVSEAQVGWGRWTNKVGMVTDVGGECQVGGLKWAWLEGAGGDDGVGWTATAGKNEAQKEEKQGNETAKTRQECLQVSTNVKGVTKSGEYSWLHGHRYFG